LCYKEGDEMDKKSNDLLGGYVVDADYFYDIQANLDPNEVNINEKHLYSITTKNEILYGDTSYYTSFVSELASKNEIDKVNILLNNGASLEDAAFGAGLAKNIDLINDLLKRAQTEKQRHAILSQAVKGATIKQHRELVKNLIQYGAKLSDVAEAAAIGYWTLNEYQQFEDNIKEELKYHDIDSVNNIKCFYLSKTQILFLNSSKYSSEFLMNYINQVKNQKINEQEHKIIFWPAFSVNPNEINNDFYNDAEKYIDIFATIFNAFGFGLKIDSMNAACQYISKSDDTPTLEKLWKEKFADQFALGLLQGGHEYALHQLFNPKDDNTLGNHIKFDECNLEETLIYLANKYQQHPLIEYILNNELYTTESYLYLNIILHDQNNVKKCNFDEEINVLNKLFLNHKYSDVKWFANFLLEAKYNDKKQYILYQEYLSKFILIANELENTKMHVNKLESEYNKEIKNKDFSSTRNSLTVQKIHAFDNLINELSPQIVDLLKEIKPKDGIQPNKINDKKQEKLKEKSEEIAKTFKKYEPILEKQRNYKNLIAEIALVFAGLGIGYVFAALVNKAITNHFSFFRRPESLKVVNHLNTSIQGSIHKPKS
jgi:hypothetical protein